MIGDGLRLLEWLVDVETSKAVIEVVAPTSGILLRLFRATPAGTPGATVDVVVSNANGTARLPKPVRSVAQSTRESAAAGFDMAGGYQP